MTSNPITPSLEALKLAINIGGVFANEADGLATYAECRDHAAALIEAYATTREQKARADALEEAEQLIQMLEMPFGQHPEKDKGCSETITEVLKVIRTLAAVSTQGKKV